MFGEFPISHREIRLESASVAPTQAYITIHVRLGYDFKHGPKMKDGSIDFISGLARRYRPVVLPYPRELLGPGNLYAAVLVEESGSVNVFTFNVAYRVIK